LRRSIAEHFSRVFPESRPPAISDGRGRQLSRRLVPTIRQLDSLRTGPWREKAPQIVSLNVPRDQVVAFALYTHDAGVLKLSAQLYPLLPNEPLEARLEVQRDGAWTEIVRADIEGRDVSMPSRYQSTFRPNCTCLGSPAPKIRPTVDATEMFAAGFPKFV
jgi:hypothetical protein